ncbi:imm11 family protein [Agarilytica rhodophyticola]|uniref:imm11 family protein n=1 Tax=Agarilytica rhodophyticola TaxID=1737490 RepID=UPI000B342FA3|nr:DUF1629 domain-containing protein [Agarilytica rhodophyticola]
MKYYRLKTNQRQDEEFCFIERPPESIYLLSSQIAKGKPAAQKYPVDESVVLKMSPKRGGRVLSDFIGTKNLSVIVSQPVMETIKDACGDACEYLPVSIENHKGRIAASDYFYINPLGTFDVLDKDHSDIKYTDDGKVIRVRKYVLSGEKIKSIPPLFRVNERDTYYFINEDLVSALSDAKPDLSNLNLEPIDVIEEKKQ